MICAITLYGTLPAHNPTNHHTVLLGAAAGMCVMLAAFIIAVTRNRPFDKSLNHFQLGVAVFTLVLLQPCSSIPRLMMHHVSLLPPLLLIYLPMFPAVLIQQPMVPLSLMSAPDASRFVTSIAFIALQWHIVAVCIIFKIAVPWCLSACACKLEPAMQLTQFLCLI